jgi:type VI secretion system secreted protein Hcp
MTANLVSPPGQAGLNGTTFITVEGTKQGRFKGESTNPRHRDQIEATFFDYRVRAPRDPATGQATGRRQHGPVVFRHHAAAAASQFYQALFTNEQLTRVVFEFFRPAADGTETETETFRVTLRDAFVVDLDTYLPDCDVGQGAARVPLLQDASLSFGAILIESIDGHTSAQDTVGGS